MPLLNDCYDCLPGGRSEKVAPMLQMCWEITMLLAKLLSYSLLFNFSRPHATWGRKANKFGGSPRAHGLYLSFSEELYLSSASGQVGQISQPLLLRGCCFTPSTLTSGPLCRPDTEKVSESFSWMVYIAR